MARQARTWTRKYQDKKTGIISDKMDSNKKGQSLTQD